MAVARKEKVRKKGGVRKMPAKLRASVAEPESAPVSLRRKYNLSEAAACLAQKVGIEIDVRLFRSWIENGSIMFKRNPGERGHYFWTEDMLDSIAEQMKARRTPVGLLGNGRDA